MTPEDCPKFCACNAPICPLDAGWRRARHLPGEAICFYLHELSKATGAEVLGTVFPAEALPTFTTARAEIMAHAELCGAAGNRALRQSLAAAAYTGSRILAGRRLRARSCAT